MNTTEDNKLPKNDGDEGLWIKKKSNLPPHINTLCQADCHPKHSPIFRIDSAPLGLSPKNSFASLHSTNIHKTVDDDYDYFDSPTVLFPSMRLLLAVLLCCCYITLSISSSNIAVALICMIKCPLHGYGGDLEWESDQVFIHLFLQQICNKMNYILGGSRSCSTKCGVIINDNNWSIRR